MNVLSQGVGDLAPDFTLSTVDGSQFKLSDNSGKVVFIFLFGYACPHCLANGNNTETGIYSLYKQNNDFVAIGIDTWDGNSSAVENFISQTGITYPVALNGSGIQSLYSTTYDRIIVIDQSGIIKFKATANATTTVVNDAKQIIDGLFNTTGIENSNVKKELFNVYPIPANKNIYIDNINHEYNFTSVKIINSTGQVVFNKKLTQQDFNSIINIPTHNFSNGVYILQLKSPKLILNKRIIIADN